jgi:hypothetical protein
VDLSFKPKGVLEIVCNNFNDSKRTVYGFKFKGKRWQLYEIDDFYIMGLYDEVTFWKMKN